MTIETPGNPMRYWMHPDAPHITAENMARGVPPTVVATLAETPPGAIEIQPLDLARALALAGCSIEYHIAPGTRTTERPHEWPPADKGTLAMMRHYLESADDPDDAARIERAITTYERGTVKEA